MIHLSTTEFKNGGRHLMGWQCGVGGAGDPEGGATVVLGPMRGRLSCGLDVGGATVTDI